MRTLVCAAFALSAVVAAAAASAADPGAAPAAAAPSAGHGQWRQKFFDQLDTNHDGTISRAEYQAWVDSRFQKLDTNGDGVVDANEIASSPATVKRDERRAEHFVQRYDTSGSGQVSRADFEAKEMSRFDRLSNGADSITEDQLAAAHAFRHRRMPAQQPDSGG